MRGAAGFMIETGARLLVEGLLRAGIKHLFSLSGGPFTP
jgi:hypothetical protein